MGSVLLKKGEEKKLENLAVEFSDDFLKQKYKHDKINLYGANKEDLILFRHEMQRIILEKHKKVLIELGGNGSYNIDVGFFLKIGYFKGLNKY